MLAFVLQATYQVPKASGSSPKSINSSHIASSMSVIGSMSDSEGAVKLGGGAAEKSWSCGGSKGDQQAVRLRSCSIGWQRLASWKGVAQEDGSEVRASARSYAFPGSCIRL